jgi:DNA repair protein RadD
MLSKIELYPYQLTFIEELLRSFVYGKHLIAEAPCSFGKSYCIAEIAKRASNKGKNVLILSHRLILLRQNNGSLAEFGHSMITINDHGKNMPLDHHLYCSTLQTIQSRLKQDGFADFIKSFDLCLIDEAHVQHSNFLWESGLLNDIFVIGFTGSPKREGNNRQLGLDYDYIVESVTVNELIELNKIVPVKYYEVPFDISGLEVDGMTGDFTPKSNYKKFDNPKVYKGAIMNYNKFGQNRIFICFTSNIAHCIKTCVQFNDAGISTKFVVSNLNKPNEPKEKESGEYERYLDHLESYNLLVSNRHLLLKQTEVKSAFDSGSIKGIVCIDILSIGFDYKPLACLIMLRATQSIALLIQIGGRIQRPYQGKTDALFFDFGSNIQRLGELEKQRKWNLFHEANDAVGIPATKVCPGTSTKTCGKVILASYSLCPFCGHRFATKEELREVELIERLKEEPTDYREMSATALKDLAELKHWPIKKVFHILWSRGESPFRNGMRELGYNNNYIFRMQKMYKK